MEKWTRSVWGEAIIADDLAYLDRSLNLERQHYPVALLHLMSKWPDLARLIEQAFGLAAWIALLHLKDQRVPIRHVDQIDVEIVPGYIDPLLAEKLLLKLAISTGTH